jgi:hypothetical protein
LEKEEKYSSEQTFEKKKKKINLNRKIEKIEFLRSMGVRGA